MATEWSESYYENERLDIARLAQQILEDEDRRIAEAFAAPPLVSSTRPFLLGLACRLNAGITIDEVIDVRYHLSHNPPNSDWELRRKRVEAARARGWTKRNSRHLWAERLELLDHGADPFLEYNDDYQEWENERG